MCQAKPSKPSGVAPQFLVYGEMSSSLHCLVNPFLLLYANKLLREKAVTPLKALVPVAVMSGWDSSFLWAPVIEWVVLVKRFVWINKQRSSLIFKRFYTITTLELGGRKISIQECECPWQRVVWWQWAGFQRLSFSASIFHAWKNEWARFDSIALITA